MHSISTSHEIKFGQVLAEAYVVRRRIQLSLARGDELLPILRFSGVTLLSDRVRFPRDSLVRPIHSLSFTDTR